MEKEQEAKLEELKNFLRTCEDEASEAWESLSKAQRPLSLQQSLSTTEEIDQYRRRATDTWNRITSDCKVVREQIKTLEASYGLASWAHDGLKAYGPSLDIVSNCAVLGGSITFVSIMSATRGNISYMCYSFLFFMLGFAASIGIHMPLTWYSCGPNTPITRSSRQIREGILILCGMGGATSVSVAFMLLAACVQTMNRDPGVPAEETFSPLGAVYTGYGILGILGTGLVLSFIKFILWRLGLWAESKRIRDVLLPRQRNHSGQRSPAKSSA